MLTRQDLEAAIAGMFLGFCGCTAITGIHEGTPRDGIPCATLLDCTVEVPECRTAVACDDGRCSFEDADRGQALLSQTPGDCIEVQCDGAGTTMQAPDPTDEVDDGNPCTMDACDGTRPTHTPQGDHPCYSGPVWTEGKGICKAGIQRCDSEGNPIGGCEGEVLPEAESCLSALDDDCDGHANEEGDSCICQPGDIIDCYTGPADTEGVSACHGGKQGCLPDGLGYGPCLGEQTPAPETCDAAMSDEDCDGVSNEEGAGCVCGDGTISPGNGEACDDGNLESSDFCTASCQPAACGDGAVQAIIGEMCDDGNLDSTDACTALCQPAACGDAIVQQGESCDDGNTLDGDACPSVCFYAVAQVDLGGTHTCALFPGGSVKCWGWNAYGQLGLGDTLHRGDAPNEMGDNLPAVDLGSGMTAVAIVSGDSQSCALLSGGLVKCWGRNADGTLGLGNSIDRGDGPGEMGDNLPVVNLGAGKTAVAIAPGEAHACALLYDSNVKCWGRNDWGQLGLGDINVTRGDNLGEMGDNLPIVNLGSGKIAVAIALGGDHTCALLSDGTLKCWGANGGGQLGLRRLRPLSATVPERWATIFRWLTSVRARRPSRSLRVRFIRVRSSPTAVSNAGVATTMVSSAWVILCHRGDDPGEMGDNLLAGRPGHGQKRRGHHRRRPGYLCAPLRQHRQVLGGQLLWSDRSGR